MTTETPYGLDNAAPGTRLWRLREHPETLTLEDAVRVAQDLDAARAEAGRAAALGEIRAAIMDELTAMPGDNRGVFYDGAAAAYHWVLSRISAHPAEAEEKPDAV